MPAMLRLLLALTLVVGIVLPKVAAAVHLVFPSDVMVLVLCTGDGLVTVKIGADGEPISEPKVISEPCVMAVAVTPAAQDLTHWQRLSREFTLARALRASPHPIEPRYARKKPARAPPFLFV